MAGFVARVTNTVKAAMGDQRASRIELGRRRYNQSKRRRGDLPNNWQTYQKFLEADQWSDHIKKSDWRSDPVTNIMFRIKEHAVAVLTSMNPVTTAIPVGQDDDQVGKYVSDILKYVDEVIDQDVKSEEAVDTGASVGTAIAHITWDNTATGGQPQVLDETGNVVKPGTMWVGQMKLSIIDPANFFPGPGYDIQSAPWHIIAFPDHVEHIKREFANVPGIENLKPESSFSDTEIYGNTQYDSEDGMCMRYVMYEKQNGHINLLEWAGNITLRDEEGFYPFDLYPLAKFVYWHRRKQFFGMGIPQQIISQQKARNKLQAILVDGALKTGSPQWLINTQSGIDIEEHTDEPSLHIEVTNGNLNDAIQPLHPPAVPQYVFDQIPMIDDGMKWTTGHTDAFVGGPDAGTSTAAGILAQHQSASVFMKGPEGRFFRWLEELARIKLAFIKTFYTEARLIRLQGQDGSAAWQWFRGTDLADMEFDIKVEAGPSNPMTKVYVAKLAQELFAAKILTPEEYLEVLDFPIKDKVLARIQEEKALAQQMAMQQMTQSGGVFTPGGRNQAIPLPNPPDMTQIPPEAS